jgi:hypothetical protein
MSASVTERRQIIVWRDGFSLDFTVRRDGDRWIVDEAKIGKLVSTGPPEIGAFLATVNALYGDMSQELVKGLS